MKMKPASIARGCLLMAVAGAAMASSHREAPFIATVPKVDGTDFYMFRSYEGVSTAGTGGRSDYVTLIANYQPLQGPYGGPNYFSMDPNALYEIHIDNNGDAREDITFQFRFNNRLNSAALPIGTQNVQIPLIQGGPVSAINDPNLNLNETYSLTVVRGDRRRGVAQTVATSLPKPVDYIGQKTLGDAAAYRTYADRHINTVNIPGCAMPARVFVGQRQEGFAVNLGRIFDLVNAPASLLLDPAAIDAEGANGNHYIQRQNVTSMALEVHRSCLTAGDPVIGGWTTASLRQARMLDGSPPSGHQASEKVGGAWVQVSRLGMPLVNEVVIGLKDKDKFNASKPKDDAANFADYVTHPTLPALVETLFGAKAPTNFPRTDLMTAFLTGLPTVNRPGNITGLGAGGPLAEMLRLNTGIAATPVAAQSSLGVVAGDAAGFPNGRRLGDDVVDVSLRVAMGALCTVTGASDALKVGCKPGDAPAGGVAFVDGSRTKATDYRTAFPYVNPPLPGAKNF